MKSKISCWRFVRSMSGLPGGPRRGVRTCVREGSGGSGRNQPRAILRVPRDTRRGSTCAGGGIGRRARLRALWAVWPVEVRVLFGAWKSPAFAGLSSFSEPRDRAAAAVRTAVRTHRRRSGRPMRPCRLRVLWTNADDRLPVASPGRVEGGDGVVEGRDVADVGPQSSIAHPLDDLTELGTIGFDDEVDCQAVGGPRLRRRYDRHQGSSGPDQACGPLLDVSADDVEDKIDVADVFQSVVLEVDELGRAEVERLLAVGGAAGADDVGAGLARELRHHRPDCAGRAVREEALPRLKVAVVEQSLPRGQA